MKYIMVIDDSPTIRISIEFAIKSLGHIIQQAGNGADGLEKIKEMNLAGHEIILCIVDINMPVMDGITFIREFRKNDKFTPVLVLTTESEEDKIMKGKDVGASGWIVKPFQQQALINVIKRLIR